MDWIRLLVPYILPVILSLVVVVVLPFFLFGPGCYHLRFRKPKRRRRSGEIYIGSIWLFALLWFLNAGACAYSACNAYTAVTSLPPEEEAGQETPDSPVSDSFILEENGPSSESAMEPTGPVRSVEMLIPDFFLLSQVQDSKMLLLFKEISPDGAIAASGLTACGRKFLNYIEQCAHPAQPYSFHTGLKPLFPEGESESGFDDVSTYEESLKQIRGAGKALEKHWNSASSWQLYDDCHHLAIRAKDALYFGKKERVLTDRMTWVLGELAFAALINEAVYGNLSESDLWDWYYRFAQIFDYLGDIADTKEQRLELYYVAAVIYSLAYEQVKSHGLAYGGGEYGNDIWDAYFEMVYKVAVRVDEPLRDGFFLTILEGEADVEDSGLPEARIERTRKRLEDLGAYWSWKESPEGQKAVQTILARKGGV